MHRSLNNVTVSARSKSGPAAFTISTTEHSLTRNCGGRAGQDVQAFDRLSAGIETGWFNDDRTPAPWPNDFPQN